MHCKLNQSGACAVAVAMAPGSDVAKSKTLFVMKSYVFISNYFQPGYIFLSCY